MICDLGTIAMASRAPPVGTLFTSSRRFLLVETRSRDHEVSARGSGTGGTLEDHDDHRTNEPGAAPRLEAVVRRF